MGSTADIDIKTEALATFAGNPQVSLDDGAARGKAAAAAQGASALPAGSSFFSTHKASVHQVLAYFPAVQQGMLTYRDAASKLFDLHETAEHNSAQLQKSVPQLSETLEQHATTDVRV